MPPIRAIFENGVFRPIEKFDLPERTEVEFAPRVVTQNGYAAGALDRAYEILGRRHQADADLAARHDEHQP